jgi:uncharacterized protein YaaR (DUF327 family)
MSKISSFSFLLIPVALAISGCGDKTPANPEQAKNFQCGSDYAREKVLVEFAAKLKEEGAKGFSAATMKDIVTLKDIVQVSKDAKGPDVKCTAKISVKYPDDLADKFANLFASEKSVNDFRDLLEEKYGVVNGGGFYTQLMDAIADGPFGVVPSIPDTNNFAKYKVVIKKNLETVIAEQLDIAISYELKLDTNTGLDSAHPFVKWQINKREALDINTSLISINSAF